MNYTTWLPPGGLRTPRPWPVATSVAALQIPKVVQVASGEDYEAAVLRLGVFASLLLADEGLPLFALGLQDRQGKAFFVQEQIVYKAVGGFVEILPEFIQLRLRYLDVVFQTDIGRTVRIIKEPLAAVLQQPVDLEPRLGQPSKTRLTGPSRPVAQRNQKKSLSTFLPSPKKPCSLRPGASPEATPDEGGCQGAKQSL